LQSRPRRFAAHDNGLSFYVALVSGLITERGVLQANPAALAKAFAERARAVG
jgi:hypothetical protein